MLVESINLHICTIQIIFLVPESYHALNYIRLAFQMNLVNDKLSGNRSKIKFELMLMPAYFSSFYKLFNNAFTLSITCGRLLAS